MSQFFHPKDPHHSSTPKHFRLRESPIAPKKSRSRLMANIDVGFRFEANCKTVAAAVAASPT